MLAGGHFVGSQFHQKGRSSFLASSLPETILYSGFILQNPTKWTLASSGFILQNGPNFPKTACSQNPASNRETPRSYKMVSG
jgi:hypothetical protein